MKNSSRICLNSFSADSIVPVRFIKDKKKQKTEPFAFEQAVRK
jgi:hypothetical protein